MSDALFNATVRLAKANPALRNHLLPILKEAKDEEKESRFEEGVSADPTKNMSPEDKKKWLEQKEKNKDKFKSSSLRSATIRLAHERPDLRAHLLPLLAKGEVPEAFKEQWENDDRDNDGIENEPMPAELNEALNKKDKYKAASLRAATIRLAAEKPELRAHLLPLLASEKEAGCEKLPEGPMRDNCMKKKEESKGKDKGKEAGEFDPSEIGATEPGALQSDADEPYMKGHFTEGESNELHDKQESVAKAAGGHSKYEDYVRDWKKLKYPVSVKGEMLPRDRWEKLMGKGEHAKKSSLRAATIRLAAEKPHLRAHLLPLLQD